MASSNKASKYLAKSVLLRDMNKRKMEPGYKVYLNYVSFWSRIMAILDIELK
ncbi:hypothetical protein GCM10027342_50710 [Photobacterium alginatilyticum]